MHRLFEQVLEKKDLSKAGDLFSLEDSVIVDELSEVLKTIQVSKFIFKFFFNFDEFRIFPTSQSF